jgi:hypothetical protein
VYNQSSVVAGSERVLIRLIARTGRAVGTSYDISSVQGQPYAIPGMEVISILATTTSVYIHLSAEISE